MNTGIETWYDDMETFEVNYDEKIWEIADVDYTCGSIILIKKGSRKK